MKTDGASTDLKVHFAVELPEPEVEIVGRVTFAVGSDRTTRTSNSSSSSAGRRPEGTAGPIGLGFGIITGGLGTGILVVPWLFAGASLLPAVVMTIVVIAINVYTIELLVDCAEATGEFDVGALLSHAIPGRSGQIARLCLDIFIVVTIFGSLITYNIVMAKSLNNVFTALPYWVFCLGCVLVIIPTTFLDQKLLTWTSGLCVSVYAYIIVLLVVDLGSKGIHEDACHLGYGKGGMAFFAGLANCLVIQMCVLPMYAELKDRTPALMKKTVRVSFFGILLLVISFGVSGYLLYGKNANDDLISDIMNTHGKDSVASKVVQLGMFVALGCVYPIMQSGLMAPFYSGPPVVQRYAKYIAVLVVLCGSALAIPLEKCLGKLTIILGALGVAVVTTGVPTFVSMRVLGKSPCTMYSVALLGLVLGVVGIIWQTNYATELTCVDDVLR